MHVLSNSHKKAFVCEASAIRTTKTAIAIIDATPPQRQQQVCGSYSLNASESDRHNKNEQKRQSPSSTQQRNRFTEAHQRQRSYHGRFLAIAGDGIELIPSGQPQLLSRRITQLLPKSSSQVKKIV